MILTADVIKAMKARYEEQQKALQKSAQTQLDMLAGAIVDCDTWLAELDKPEPEPPKPPEGTNGQ